MKKSDQNDNISMIPFIRGIQNLQIQLQKVKQRLPGAGDREK